MIEYISILSYFSPFFYNILPHYREGSFFLFGFSLDTPTAKAMGFLFLRPLHCRKDFSFT